jgi:hypothetical protein
MKIKDRIRITGPCSHRLCEKGAEHAIALLDPYTWTIGLGGVCSVHLSVLQLTMPQTLVCHEPLHRWRDYSQFGQAQVKAHLNLLNDTLLGGQAQFLPVES